MKRTEMLNKINDLFIEASNEKYINMIDDVYNDTLLEQIIDFMSNWEDKELEDFIKKYN